MAAEASCGGSVRPAVVYIVKRNWKPIVEFWNFLNLAFLAAAATQLPSEVPAWGATGVALVTLPVDPDTESLI